MPKSSPPLFERSAFGLHDAAMLAVVVIWGANFAVIKSAVDEISPMAFTSARFAAGAATLLIFAMFSPPMRGQLRELLSGSWKFLLLVGAVGQILFQPLFIFGVSRTAAGNAALILASAPIFVALITQFLGWERLGRLCWIGVAVCFAGVALVIVGSSQPFRIGLDAIPGDLLILASTVVWACYTVMLRPLAEKSSSLAVTTASVAIGAIGLCTIASPWLYSQDWDAVTSRGWWGVLYSGPLVVGIGYLLWVQGVRWLGPSRTALYSNLIPVVAVLVGVTLLAETITGIQMLGAVLVLAGLLLYRM